MNNFGGSLTIPGYLLSTATRYTAINSDSGIIIPPGPTPDPLPPDPASFPDALTSISISTPPLTAFSQGFVTSPTATYSVLSDMYGHLKITRNGGSTWTELRSAPIGTTSVPWATVSMTDNGQRILACRDNGNAYLSNDSGVTWTSLPHRGFTCAMSYNGKVQLLGGGSGPNSIFVSTNYGSTWSSVPLRLSDNSRGGISVSKDGTTCLACIDIGINNHRLYISRDSGGTWAQASAPAGEYRAVTCSSKDGSVMYAVKFFGDYRCIKSTDYGQTWTDASATSPLGAYGLFTSYDGKYVLVTCRYGRGIFISKNSGATWTQYYNGTDMSGGSIDYSGRYFGFVKFGTNDCYLGSFN
jgi:photosystem II stability/assembly factor-like uncharacterized protein